MATGEATHGPYADHIGIETLPNRRQRFKERARADYVSGADERWRKRTGRPMNAAEIERVLRRYPGDL